MSEHSKLPWFTNNQGSIQNEDSYIADVDKDDDLDFIVKACNEHDALIVERDALKEALEHISLYAEQFVNEQCEHIKKLADETLSKWENKKWTS